MDRLLARNRARAGVRVIRSGGPLKEMVTALRRGEVIGLAADQDAGPEGCFTPFLGRKASFYRGAAYFTWKLQAPVISGVVSACRTGATAWNWAHLIAPSPTGTRRPR